MGIMLPYLILTLSLISTAMSQGGIGCNNPADIMFLLDGSDSIDAQEWDQERNFVARMINGLNINPTTINVGFTVYSSNIDQHVGLIPFRPKIVLNAVARNLQHPTGIATNTAAGIAKIRETFANQPSSRAIAPKIMIVITDGSSENPAETIRQAQIAKADGVRIIAVGVGNNVFEEELLEIATNRNKFYSAPTFAALQGIESDIRNMICRVITTTPSPRFTFAPPTMPREVIPVGQNIQCNNPADIVFLIDGSDSISDVDYVRLKNFVSALIDNFEIGPDAIHVGLIVYSTLVGNKIGLFPPKNKFVLKALTKNLKHPKFGTDTALGIEAARSMIRDQGRPNAPSMVVVITDGRSTYHANTVIQSGIAKAQGITMIAIGVGSDIFSDELNQIATGPKYVSEVADFRALENTVNVMRDLICTSITTPATTTTTMLPPTPPPRIPPPPADLICNVPGDVVFVLDGSSSIAPNDWIRQRNFVSNLINALEVGRPYIHVSVVVFSTTIGEVVPLMPYQPKSVLMAKVSSLKQPRFGTDTALGIQEARKILKEQGRPTAPRLVIIVTDGKSTFPDNTRIQSIMAKTDGITMIAVGVGTDIYEDELDAIASSQSQTFKVIDFASLKLIIEELRNRICQVVQKTTPAPVITTTPVPTTTEMTTPSHVPLFPCIESQTEADVLFLMDGTASMSAYNWMMTKHFAGNFLDGLYIQPSYVHIGMVVSDTFRGDSTGLNFKTKQHVKEQILGLLHPKGDMNTASGLRDVYNHFNQQGRPTSQKVLIFLTDGKTRSMADTSREAQRLKDKGVDIVTVGMGPDVSMPQLLSMASKPGLTLQNNVMDQSFRMLPRLQNIVCDLLKKPETTTVMTTTTQAPLVVPPLCEGCLVDQGVGFNSFKGDCTKYVQCWKEGNEIKFLVRACPFGQYWDTDAITCRPSFLVRCTADPCHQSQSGFTYGMSEYGCRAYWKCIDGFSIGHCCPRGSAYIDGMGCIESTTCTQECPPSGGIAVNPTCDRKPHWDKRYYIEIVYGRGEIIRPCPAGTIFYEDKCECDFGMSGLQPTRPDVQCQPMASFPFNLDLQDKSLHGINVGVTNVQRTDLGTAYFNGQSNMNMWRFAGADWGNQLVIKFKFRFDFSNKYIDYGGIPVDLGIDLDANIDLVSQYHMTDMDWRLWNKLRQVRTLADWRALLKEFGQSRTFYIFLGALGFKPGTSNSMQVVRILGTPEAFAQFDILLTRMRPRMGAATNTTSAAGLKNILTLLKSMRGLIDWRQIINDLKGDAGGSTATGTGSGSGTVTVGGTTITGTVDFGTGSTGPGGQVNGTREYRWDAVKGQWVRTGNGATGKGNGAGGITVVTGGKGGTLSSNLLNIAGTETASDWRFNEKTGQWERLAAVDLGGGIRGGMNFQTDSQNSMSGGVVGNTMGGVGTNQWHYKAHGSNRPITNQGGAVGNQSATGTGMTQMQWEDILRNMLNAQNGSTGTQSGSNFQFNTQGGGSQFDLQALLGQMGQGGNANNTGTGSWQYTGGMNGAGAMNQSQVDAFLRMLNARMTQGGAGGAQGNATTGGRMDMSQLNTMLGQLEGQMASNFFGASGNATGLEASLKDSIARTMLQQIQETAQKMEQHKNKGFGFDASGSFTSETQGGTFTGGSATSSSASAGGMTGGMSAASGGLAGGAFGQMGGASGGFQQQGGAAGGAFGQMGGANGGFQQRGGAAGGGFGQMGGANSGFQQMGGVNGNMGGFGFDASTLGGMNTGGTGGMFFEGGSFDTGLMGAGGSLGGMATDASFNTAGAGLGFGGAAGGAGLGFGGGAGGDLLFGSIDTTAVNAGTGVSSGATGSKHTVQTRVETETPLPTASVSGGRVVGGAFGAAGGQTMSGGVGGMGVVRETSSRLQGNGGSAAAAGVAGITVPQQREFVSGATVVGRGDKRLSISPDQVGLRINEFTHDVNPATMEALGGRFTSGGGAAAAGGRHIRTGTSGMAGGDFTQMGRAVGIGGGVQRIIDTNVKRVPGSTVQFNPEGGVSLASLGLGGAEGENIIRHTVRLESVGGEKFVDAGLVGSNASVPSGLVTGTVGGSMDASLGGVMSSGPMPGSMGGVGQDFLSAGSLSGHDWNRGSAVGGAGSVLPFMAMEGAENMFEGLLGKKRKRRSARNKRQAANRQGGSGPSTKQAYQALVTNCQGQGGQGPSIMVVANRNDVQFALKTYNKEPAVVAVKAVEGWNDVTLIYDGKTLTGVVENWKGFHRSSVAVEGKIERRQAGLLVGACEGFRNFHGEIDDLTVYKCITPEIAELRDRNLM